MTSYPINNTELFLYYLLQASSTSLRTALGADLPLRKLKMLYYVFSGKVSDLLAV